MSLKFTELKLKGAYSIEVDKLEDARGFFGRIWCKEEFEKRGLNTNLVQSNVSFSKQKGTVRGLHYQKDPHAETKLLRCTRGKVFDVIVDLREGSETYGQWASVELSAENRKMIYVPEGFAHGFMTLEDDTEVYYLVTEFYHGESEGGVRWNDPTIGIEWPLEVTAISPKDEQQPLLNN